MQSAIQMFEFLPQGISIGGGVQRIALKMPVTEESGALNDPNGFAAVMSALLSLPPDQLQKSLNKLDWIPLEETGDQLVPMIDLTSPNDSGFHMFNQLMNDVSPGVIGPDIISADPKDDETIPPGSGPDKTPNAAMLPQAAAVIEETSTVGTNRNTQTIIIDSVRMGLNESVRMGLDESVRPGLDKKKGAGDQERLFNTDPLFRNFEKADPTKPVTPMVTPTGEKVAPVETFLEPVKRGFYPREEKLVANATRVVETLTSEDVNESVQTSNMGEDNTPLSRWVSEKATPMMAEKGSETHSPNTPTTAKGKDPGLRIQPNLNEPVNQETLNLLKEKPDAGGDVNDLAQFEGSKRESDDVSALSVREGLLTSPSRSHSSSIERHSEGAADKNYTLPNKDQGVDVIRQIVERMNLKQDRLQSQMQIRLKPEFLGDVRLQITTQNHQVMVRISAESNAVKEMIEQNLPVLKNDLQQHGLEIDKFDVYVGHDDGAWRQRRQQNASGQESQYRSAQGGSPGIIEDNSEESFSTDSRRIVPGGGRGGIDFFA